MRRLVRSFAVLTTSVGLLVVAAWILGIEDLKSLVPGWATMKLPTAVMFAAAGSGLLATTSPGRPGLRYAVAAGGATLAVSGWFLLGGPEYPEHHWLSPSGATLLSLALTGLAVLLRGLPGRRQQLWATSVALLGATPPFVALIGYVLGPMSVYSAAPFSTMAFHTAATAVLLSAGVALSERGAGPASLITSGQLAGQLIRRMLPLTLMLPVVLALAAGFGVARDAFDANFGLVAVAGTLSIVMSAAFWGVARRLDQVDRDRIAAVDGLKAANETLAQRVDFATAELRHANDALKRQIEATRNAQSEFETLFELAPDAMLLVGPDGRLRRVNDQACTLFGYSRDEFMALGVEDLMPAEFRAAHHGRREEYARDPRPRMMSSDRVLPGKRRDGTVFITEISLSPTRIQGAPNVIATIRDVTEQTRLVRRDGIRRQVLGEIAEGAPLRKLLGQICEAIAAEVEGAGVAIAAPADQEGDEALAAGAGPNHRLLQQIAGQCLKSDALARRAEDEVLRLDAADLAAVGAGSFPEIGGTCILVPPGDDGRILLAIALQGPEGRSDVEVDSAIRFCAELAGQAVHKARSRAAQEIAASVFAASEQGIVVTDRKNRIVSVNQAFCRILGYAPEEVIGRSPSVWKSGHHTAEFYQRMWAGLQSEGAWEGEILDRSKLGELLALWMSVSVIRDEHGDVHRHVCMLTDVTARKEAEAVIARQANYDALTGLPNRRLFLDRLDQELGRARRAGTHVALFFLDLDHFKEVNDTLGHEVGDQLLLQAGERIRSCVRASDTVARLGGDEFTVLLPDLGDSRDAEPVADKIVAALGEPFVLGKERVSLTTSLGITLYPDDSTDPQALLRNADQAMYQAKVEGKDRFSYFTPEMQASALRRLRLHQDLIVALEQDQFEVHYQPIVDGRDGRMAKLEALVRWRHPEKGMISPGQFIPVAEEFALIVPIGDHVFDTVLDDLPRFDAAGLGHLAVSVNKSPRQFLRDGSSERRLGMLKERGIAPERIILEITESLLLDSRPDVYARLRQYRDAGVRIAIDDFGTGYSALGYLKRFPIDIVKIDRSFVSDLGDRSSDLALVEAIVVMAQKLGLEVIAEGVETEHQRRLLLDIGCMTMQGFLFGRPQPIDEIFANCGGRPGS